MMLQTIEDKINGMMKFKIYREISIPGIESNRKGRKKYPEIYDIIKKFASSDMDIASVDIHIYFDRRDEILLEQAICSAARANDIKVNKRGDKIYLSKINKED